jgi:hypothetical protein
MVTGDDIQKTVRYRDPKTQGEKIGTLIALEKQRKKFIAIVQTPIVGQRKRRLPAETVEVYEEKA